MKIQGGSSRNKKRPQTRHWQGSIYIITHIFFASQILKRNVASHEDSKSGKSRLILRFRMEANIGSKNDQKYSCGPPQKRP